MRLFSVSDLTLLDQLASRYTGPKKRGNGA